MGLTLCRGFAGLDRGGSDERFTAEGELPDDGRRMTDAEIIPHWNYTREDYRGKLFGLKGIGLWWLCHLITTGYKMHACALR